MSDYIYPICVIGGGSAGVMAVTRAVLNNDECLFFPGSPKHRKKSRAFWVAKVENVPAHLDYKKGIVEPNNKHLEWLSEGDFKDKLTWKKNLGVHSLSKRNDGVFEITDTKEGMYLAKNVILCTGVMDVQPVIDGSIQPVLPYANLQTVDYCIRCDGHHILNKNTVIIGDNSDAFWVAAILHERYNPPSMTILTHGNEVKLEGKIAKMSEVYGFKHYSSEIVEVIGQPKEGLLEGFKLADGTTINCEMAFTSLGMIVYNELAKALGTELDERGFVITNTKGMSSVNGLYVAGDLRANTKKQIYTSWDTAVDAADAINSKLREEKRNQILS